MHDAAGQGDLTAVRSLIENHGLNLNERRVVVRFVAFTPSFHFLSHTSVNDLVWNYSIDMRCKEWPFTSDGIFDGARS